MGQFYHRKIIYGESRLFMTEIACRVMSLKGCHESKMLNGVAKSFETVTPQNASKIHET